MRRSKSNFLCDTPRTTLPSYRPPALRNGPVGASSGATFSLAYDESSKPGGRIKSGGVASGGVGPTGKALPPGAEFVSKAAAKNAKKRASKKSKGPGVDGHEDGGADDAPSSSGAGAAEEAAATSIAALGLGSGGGDGGDGGDAITKKLRALQKKLRQIQQLKEKRDAEGEPRAAGRWRVAVCRAL